MKSLIVFLTTLMTIPCFAVTMTNSTLTPGVGQSEINVSLNYFSLSGSTNNGDLKFSGLANKSVFTLLPGSAADTDSTLSYFYGISDTAAIGVALGYTSVSTTSTPINQPGTSSTDNGLTGLTLAYKGNWDLLGLTLYTYLGYEAPLSQSTSTTDVNDNVSENGSLTKPNLTAILGPMWDLGSVVVGGLLRYTYQLQGSDHSSSPNLTYDSTDKGGDSYEVGPLVELKNDFHPSLEADYGRSFGTNSTVNNVTQYSDGTTYTAVTVSSRYALNPSFELNGALTYSSVNFAQSITISGESIRVGGRFLF